MKLSSVGRGGLESVEEGWHWAAWEMEEPERVYVATPRELAEFVPTGLGPADTDGGIGSAAIALDGLGPADIGYARNTLAELGLADTGLGSASTGPAGIGLAGTCVGSLG